jgi:hypothetical protein
LRRKLRCYRLTGMEASNGLASRAKPGVLRHQGKAAKPSPVLAADAAAWHQSPKA